MACSGEKNFSGEKMQLNLISYFDFTTAIDYTEAIIYIQSVVLKFSIGQNHLYVLLKQNLGPQILIQ